MICSDWLVSAFGMITFYLFHIVKELVRHLESLTLSLSLNYLVMCLELMIVLSCLFYWALVRVQYLYSLCGLARSRPVA